MSAERLETLRKVVENLSPTRVLLPSDVLGLPDDIAFLLNTVHRGGGMALPELAALLGLEPAEAQEIAALLIERNYLHLEEAPEGPRYLVKYGGRVTAYRQSPLDKL
jgi:hypothetical protein